ncbi:MAG: C40 family peptidase [Coriobacteriales bacterium]
MTLKGSDALSPARPLRRSFAAFALAASVALMGTPVGAVPAAFADETPAIVIDASGIELAADGSHLSVSSVLDQIEAQAQAQTQSTPIAAMDEVVAKVVKKAAKLKASKIDKVLDTAKSLKGTPYVYGGSTPSGFDCSGFTMYCFAKAGVSLTHNAQAQFYQTKSVPTNNMKAGDLVFFGWSTSSITHVGIYVGNGKYIHSPHTGASVRVETLDDRSNFVGATRPIK